MKKKTIIKAAAYIISVLFVLSYLYILWQGMHPENISKEYRMYYIEHTLKDWPGNGGLHYTYGTIEYFDMEQEPQIKRSVGGWAEPDEEEPGRWTVGENAGLLYDIDDSNGPVIVAFTTTKVMPGVSVEFTATGEVLGSFEPEADSEYSFEIQSLSAGELLLEFHITNPVSPKELGLSQNDSKYGVQLKSLVIRQEGGSV